MLVGVLSHRSEGETFLDHLQIPHIHTTSGISFSNNARTNGKCLSPSMFTDTNFIISKYTTGIVISLTGGVVKGVF